MPEELETGAPEPSDSELLGFASEGESIADEWDAIQKSESGSEPSAEEPTKEGEPASEPDTTKAAATDEKEGAETAPEPAKEATGEESPEPTDAGDGTVSPAESKFSFLGRDYESLDAAEHAIRSHMGSVSGLQRQNTELQELLAKSTAALENRLDSVTASPETRTAPADAPLTPAGADAGKSEAKGAPKLGDFVNWRLYQQIPTIGDYTEEDQQAYLDQQTSKFDEANAEYQKTLVDERIQEHIGPVREQTEQIAKFRETSELMIQMADRLAVDPEDGQEPVYLYPELREDQDFVKNVAEKWLNEPRLYDQGEYGIHLAYLEHRHMQGLVGASNGVSPDASVDAEEPAATLPSETVTQSVEARNRAALAGSSAAGASTREATRHETYGNRINQELEEDAKKFNDDVTGVPGF